MRIVMDFDGVYTDPSREGESCSVNFRNKIVSLGLNHVGLGTGEAVDSWLGELRVRQAREPFRFGWRSEGKVSAFTFEDPFIRNIGLADYLDHLVKTGNERATQVLKGLAAREKIRSFGELSEWAFHEMRIKKDPDREAKAWVISALEQGHEVFIVSNSATDKIHEFLDQSGFPKEKRPNVRGGARKFGLGVSPQPLMVGQLGSSEVVVDTDRPLYESALLEINPDAVIGDVFCLDLALPVRLKRQKKLSFSAGIHYRCRDYTPSLMVGFFGHKDSKIPEVSLLRDWDQLAL